MTTTFSTVMKDTLEKIIGINILRENIFWGNVQDMMRRNINIEISCHPQYFNDFKSEIKKAFENGSNKKAIVYLNTAHDAIKFKEKVDMWLDEESPFVGDSVLVYGDMHQEVKAEIIVAFTSNQSVQPDMAANVIYPRILIATSGSVGAGLDSHDINLVYRIGCPSSVFEFIQEMGRCGRIIVHGITGNINKYSIHLSLEDYIYMYERIHTAKDRQDGVLTISEQNEMQEKNLFMVLRLLVLKRMCYHKALELSKANVCIDDDGHSNCKTACPRCNKEDENMFLKVNQKM